MEVPQTRTFFYYCISGGMPSDSSNGKQYILHTSIKEITGEEADIRAITRKWAEYVQDNCENASGCTSDLNYYLTADEAKQRLEWAKVRFSDKAKFIRLEVDF